MKKAPLTLIAAMTFLFAACTQNPSISIDPTEILSDYKGGSTACVLTANGSWTAQPSDPSIVVSPISGTGDSPVSITLPANTAEKSQTFTVTFVCEIKGKSASVVVSIIQRSQNPSIQITYAHDTVSYNVQTVPIKVISSLSWTATSESAGVLIAPANGNGGSTDVVINIPTNTTKETVTYKVKFASGDSTDTYVVRIVKSFTIKQLSAASPVIAVTDTVTLGYQPDSDTIKLTSNYPWKAKADEGLVLSAINGESDKDIIVTTAAMNKTNDKVVLRAYFECEVNSIKAYDTLIVIQNPATKLSYGGVDYKVKWLPDGKLWMCENLRYVPEGKTISEDVTDNNGIWYSCGTDWKVETNADSVAFKGLLYNCETAFGGVTITKDNYSTFTGVRGICPQGWHIPTSTEFVNLEGKGVGEIANNTNAPFYDSGTGKSSVTLANEAGFNIITFGYRNQSNKDVAGAYLKLAVYNGKIQSDMIMGSSVALKNGAPTYTPVSTSDPTIKNVQYYCIMPFVNASNNSLNLSLGNFKSGVHVRCVKD